MSKTVFLFFFYHFHLKKRAFQFRYIEYYLYLFSIGAFNSLFVSPFRLPFLFFPFFFAQTSINVPTSSTCSLLRCSSQFCLALFCSVLFCLFLYRAFTKCQSFLVISFVAFVCLSRALISQFAVLG